MVTFGFNGTYSVQEDAGGIRIVVLVLVNYLARDISITLFTVDDTARGRFANLHGSLLTIYLSLTVCS